MSKLTLVALCAAAVSAAAAPWQDNVKNIIIFMQENRAYDHYYGTHQGVRGFNDRTAHPLPSGLNAFYQPVGSNMSEYMLPFHVDTMTTSAICMDAPTMNYPTDILMMNEGRYDAWNTARSPGMGMSHFNRSDLPYYYTLYDAFTHGDSYHQSTFTQTNPNRLHLFSGSNGLSAGYPAVLDNTEPVPGFEWITMGEVLEDAGISWKVYQEADNFDDNAFAFFKSFQDAKPGDPLYDKGMARMPDLIEQLDADMTAGTLPQVSWIVGPANVSEHATWHPAAGEDFSARILKVVEAHPEVYANTVFILNYDEGGQFFDHHHTPTPPVNAADGVSTVTTKGEVTLIETPIGLGFRVPLLIISPWTRGNIVVSETFDHTSVIRFVEEKFNVTCPNISPWRRTVTGDLLSAFDWDHPDYSWPSNLPDTSNYVQQADTECSTLPAPSIPAEQSYPTQEPGVVISRALPYEFLVNDSAATTTQQTILTISIANRGAAGGWFTMFDALNGKNAVPRKYAVEAGKSIADPLPLPSWSSTAFPGTQYAWSLHGANGFVRQFGGDFGAAGGASLTLQTVVGYDVASTSLVMNLTNTGAAGSKPVVFTITDNAYNLSGSPWSYTVAPGTTTSASWNISASGNWYDFTASAGSPGSGSSTPSIFQRRFMGRMETGVDTVTDPAMGWGVPTNGPGIDSVKGLDTVYSRSTTAQDHPFVPEFYRYFKRQDGDLSNKDAMYKWSPDVAAEL